MAAVQTSQPVFNSATRGKGIALVVNTAPPGDGTSDIDALLAVHQGEVQRALNVPGPILWAALVDLASSFFSRYKQRGAVDDLNEAITNIERAVESTPADDPTLPSRLSNAGVYLQTRFMRVSEDDTDLEDAIEDFEAAIEKTPDDDLSKPARISNLATCFQLRFKESGERDDIDEAISHHRRAVELALEDDKPARRSSLGNALYTRFKTYRELQDITAAIAELRPAVDAALDTDSSKYIYRDHLGIYLQAHFKLTGERDTIDEAITNAREAVKLAPDNVKAKYRADLGSCLQSRFQASNDAQDLDNAVDELRQAGGDTRDDDPDTPARLSNLAHCLYTRYKRDTSANAQDIEDAIAASKRAVQLTSQDDAVDKSARTGNLAIYYLARVKRLPQPTPAADLDAMVAANQSCVDLTPEDHASRATRLINLGGAFQLRFEKATPGVLKDIDDAIAMYRTAEAILEESEKASHLSVIASATYLRFKRTKDTADIEAATTTYERAVEMTLDDDPRKPARLSNLAKFRAARKRAVPGSSRP